MEKKIIAWKTTAAECSIRPEVLQKLKAAGKDLSHTKGTGRKRIRKQPNF